MTQPVTIDLDPVELDVLFDVLDLGPAPAALALPSPGRTPTERTGVIRRAMHRLRGRGLAERHRVHAPLAAALTAAAIRDHTLDLRITGPRTDPLLALGCLRRDSAEPGAVLLIRRHRGVRLAVTDAARLPTELVALAGPLTAGRAKPVAIPADAFDAALAADGPDGPATAAALTDALVDHGISRADATAAGHIYRDAHTAGQLGASGPAARRAPWVVGFHHGPGGAFVQLRRRNPHGPGTSVTLAPVDAPRLVRHAEELIAAVDPADAGRPPATES